MGVRSMQVGRHCKTGVSYSEALVPVNKKMPSSKHSTLNAIVRCQDVEHRNRTRRL